MPCPKCGRTRKNAIGKYVIYCRCGSCNFCHSRYICPDGKHWYKHQSKTTHREKYDLQQSLPHGFPHIDDQPQQKKGEKKGEKKK